MRGQTRDLHHSVKSITFRLKQPRRCHRSHFCVFRPGSTLRDDLYHFFTLNLARMTLRDRALTAYKEKEMNLDRYIEELKSLVNVDCGTQTIAGVAAVAGILESLWQREGWHTG